MNFKDLTRKELETLDLLARCYDFKEIAEILGVSITTVKTHLDSIYDKCNVKGNRSKMQKSADKIRLVLNYLQWRGYLSGDWTMKTVVKAVF